MAEKPVFGVRLRDVAPGSSVPPFLRTAIRYLNDKGLQTVGLFKQSVDSDQLARLRATVEMGNKVDYEAEGPHAAAGLIRMFLRELPEPLLTFAHYDTYVAAVSIPDKAEMYIALKDAIHELPEVNHNVVQLLSLFLQRVSDFESENMMTVDTLASVFWPYFIYQEGADDSAKDAMSAVCASVVAAIIDQCEYLFDLPFATEPAARAPLQTKVPAGNFVPNQTDLIVKEGVETLKNLLRAEAVDVDAFEAAVLFDSDYPCMAAVYKYMKLNGEGMQTALASLVQIANERNNVLSLLKWAINWEIECTNSKETLFRGNSVATRLMIEYAKLIGSEFLLETVSPAIVHLASCVEAGEEFDVVPATSKSNVEKNIERLTNMCQLFLDSVTSALNSVPTAFRHICNILQNAVAAKYPDAKHQVVGGFFFLRFVCPSILDPRAWGLPLVTDPRMSRILILISKTLQNLANNVKYTQTKKDMLPLNVFLEANEVSIRRFFDDLAAPLPVDLFTQPQTRRTAVADSANAQFLTEHIEKVFSGFKTQLDGLERESSVSDSNSEAAGTDVGSEGSAFNPRYSMMRDIESFEQIRELQSSPVSGDGEEPRRRRRSTASGPVFGVSLSLLAARETGGKVQIPSFLKESLRFINKNITTKGLFVTSPSFAKANEVHVLRALYNKGGVAAIHSDTDVHVVTTLIKTYFMELPEPLIPEEWHEPCLSALASCNDDTTLLAGELQEITTQMPQINRIVLQLMARFLGRVAGEPANDVDLAALGSVFGPIWMPSKTSDAVRLAATHTITSTFIDHYDICFVQSRRGSSASSKGGSMIDSPITTRKAAGLNATVVAARKERVMQMMAEIREAFEKDMAELEQLTASASTVSSLESVNGRLGMYAELLLGGGVIARRGSRVGR